MMTSNKGRNYYRNRYPEFEARNKQNQSLNSPNQKSKNGLEKPKLSNKEKICHCKHLTLEPFSDLEILYKLFSLFLKLHVQ